MGSKSAKIVALCGNPNCGKSSLFNDLTGLKQKISNIPGTTIEQKTGFFSIDGSEYELIDTPGTYSFHAKSKDEEVALELFTEGHPKRPDVIVYVADAHNLKRNLFYFSQLADLKIPMVLVLNMIDVSEASGIEIDVTRLQEELGIPVIKTNARRGIGIQELKQAINGSEFVSHLQFGDNSGDDIALRYQRLNVLIGKVQTQKTKRQLFTERIDPIFTHPLWGYLIFLSFLLIIFQSVFWLAEYPMQAIEFGFDKLGAFLLDVMPANWFRSLIVNGIVAG